MCAKDLYVPSGAHYLIVLHDCVVLQDIADTIKDFDPRAQVIAATTPDGALSALIGVERVAVAFIEAAPQAFRETDLAAAIVSRGGQNVFVGDAAEDAGISAHWNVLRRPFSSDAILAHLTALMPE